MNRNGNCQTNGWLKVPRSILTLPDYHDGPFDMIRSLLDLMLMAEWRESREVRRRGRAITIMRGQLAVSEPGLAARWSVTRKRARGILNRLAKEGYISIDRIGKVQTIITINEEAGPVPPQPGVQSEEAAVASALEPPASEQAESPSALPAQIDVDQRHFSEFFSEERQISREQVCRRFHISEEQLTEHVRAIAEEWLLTDTRHRDYNDWSRHVINTLNIRLNSGTATTSNRQLSTINNHNNNPFTNPTPEAYGYNSTENTTDTQELQDLILSSSSDNLNALQLPPGATWSQIVAVANASAAKRHGGDRYTTKAERDAEYAVYVQKQLAKARRRQQEPDYDPFA